MKKLSFEYQGRTLEVRMVPHDGGFVCHVWDGERQASSVPYSISEAQVSTATEQGDLDLVLEEALAEVRDAVKSGDLVVT